MSLSFGESPVHSGGKPFHRTKSIRFWSTYRVQTVLLNQFTNGFQEFREKSSENTTQDKQDRDGQKVEETGIERISMRRYTEIEERWIESVVLG